MRKQLAMVLAVALAAACTDGALAPATEMALQPTAPVASLWAEQVTGEIGPGALYGLYKPVNWNREVVYYSHGFVDASAPVALPTTQDGAEALRDALGTMGYAVAYSSYSSNGYDYADGLRRTHQLRGLVRANFGVPTRNWLAGHSLGSQIALGLAEGKANQYDGALLMCGVVGGSRYQFNWVGDIRVLFDYFYPGVLPGDVTAWPANLNPYAEIPPRVLAAIGANPTGFGAIMRIDQTPLAGTNQTELVTSLITDLIWHARGIGDVTGRTQGHLPYENIHTTYTSALLPAAFMAQLNATVPRYDSPPDAQAWLDRYFEPTGDVGIPVLTLHTIHDQSVPYRHETRFAGLVAAAGTGNLVVQRAINRYGHCNFQPSEVLTAFTDLVTWVNTGVRPTP